MTFTGQNIDPGTSPTVPVAIEVINSKDYQAIKLVDATALSETPTGVAANPLQTNDATGNTEIGILTETAPASDTASSGLNGRLQRIAQRLTSLIGLLPASLGQKTMANSFGVVVASDQSAIPVSQTTPVQAATATLANVAGSASSGTLQASNASRKGLVIVNDSTAILYVKFGSAATTSSYTYFLAGSVGGVPATLELPSVVYTGIVTGIWASATGNARITELT